MNSRQPDTKRLPCPYCRGHGYQRVDPPRQSAVQSPLETLDVQILKAYWQFLAMHHGPPTAQDIAEMIPQLGTQQLFARRLKNLQRLGYIGPRQELRKVPFLAHFLDWNIVLPEPANLMVDDPPVAASKEPDTKSWLSLMRQHGQQDDDPDLRKEP